MRVKYNRTILGEFGEQHQHQRIKKSTIFNIQSPIFTLLVQIRCKFNSHFDWIVDIYESV